MRNLHSEPDVPFQLKTRRIADSDAHVRRWAHSCFPTYRQFRSRHLKGESESYGSTIIKRQSPKTEREGTLDSGQLRRGADRPSGPNAVWNKQFRPPGNHQQHRGNRKAARVFDVPVVLTTVETKSFSGNMWPQLRAVFPGQ